MHSFIHPSFIHSLIHSFINSFLCSFLHSFIQSIIHSIINHHHHRRRHRHRHRHHRHHHRHSQSSPSLPSDNHHRHHHHHHPCLWLTWARPRPWVHTHVVLLAGVWPRGHRTPQNFREQGEIPTVLHSGAPCAGGAEAELVTRTR